MKGRLLGVAAAAAMILGFAASGAQAASAKFAASYDEDPVWTFAFDTTTTSGNEFNTIAEMDMATIHIGSSKSVLISISGQVGIALLTAAKGKSDKDGSTGTSVAVAAAGVGLGLTLIDVDDPTNECTVVPGPVIFDAQLQALAVSAKADDETSIEIGVALLTAEASAHHFEFIGLQCGQGTYKATATFDLAALALAFGQESLAGALVVLGNRIITLQEVRAVKDSIIHDGD